MLVNQTIAEGAKKMILDCMGAMPGEKLLVVADEITREVGYSFAVAGRECGIQTTYVEAPAQTKGEPPAPVAAAMLEADVEFLITSMSYSHVNARVAANKKGARVASMPMITTHIAENYFDADYKKIKDVSVRLAEMLTKANLVRVTTALGTDVTLDISGRAALADTGDLTEKGALGNLPAGEAYVAPLETKGEGKIVVDGCIGYLGPLTDPVTLTLKDGRIAEIEGEESARRLREFLADKDDEAVGIAEFGIGTNPAAKIIGNILLDEKVWGTIHIAFGMNVSMGGTRQSNIHYDCIINAPTVYLDGECVLRDGEHVY